MDVHRIVHPWSVGLSVFWGTMETKRSVLGCVAYARYRVHPDVGRCTEQTVILVHVQIAHYTGLRRDRVPFYPTHSKAGVVGKDGGPRECCDTP